MDDELLKLHQADYGDEEEQELLAALRSGWLTRGPRTRRFEEQFAARVGCSHALGTNSCTAALHLALLAAGVGPGDEVIVPALTFAASANVTIHCGATPVFADVLPDTHTIDPAHVEQLISPRTKAIIPVHFAGIPCELTALHALAQRHGLFLLEDCAHAIEAEYRGRPVGVGAGDTPTRFAAYSFYATKNLVTGEGGMLTCRDAADLERATVLGLHGMSAHAWQRFAGAGGDGGFKLYDIVAAGYKYNMFDLQAALGLVQLRKLDANWELRRQRVAQYDALIADVEGVTPLAYPAHVKPAHHLYIVRLANEMGGAGVPPAISGNRGRDARATQTGEAQSMGETAPHASPVRDAVIQELRARNIEAYVHYICLTETEFYRGRLGLSAADTPVAASLSRRSITLPLFPTMTADDVERVVAALREALGETVT
jgi:dTDP-4-amino-4,6-dideoxygalactose transaminase